VKAWIAAHGSCRTDADCQTIVTDCGLDGMCGVVTNSGVDPALAALIAEWKPCRPMECLCPLLPVPACNNGLCGPRETGTGAVGDTCRFATDCTTGDCATALDDPGFVNGYCTLKNCDRIQRACPTGSTCKPVGGASFCLKDCDVMSNAGQCRNPDYHCCSGPGPTRDPAWCAPTGSFLCTAL
jgi:hypothetical protein